MSTNDERQIFTGLSSAEPGEIRNALCALDPVFHDVALPDLIRAVMTLCDCVEELDRRVRELESPNHER